MNALRTPTFRLIGALYLCAAFAVGATWLVLRTPFWATPVERDASGAIYLIGPERVALPPQNEVTFSGPTGRVSVPARDLALLPPPEPGGAAGLASYARIGRLASLLRGGPVTLRISNGPSLAMTTADRGLLDLGRDYWMLLASGAASFLLGTWVLVLRPREWGARMLALSGLGMMLAAFSSAMYMAHGLAGPGLLLWVTVVTNLLGTQLCGGALIAQFASYPRALVRPSRLLWIPVFVLPPTLASLTGHLPFFANYVVMLGEFLVLLGLVAAQWHASRNDPVAQAALRWISLSLLSGSSLFVIVWLAPVLAGLPPIASQGWAFLSLFTIYAGTAAGVGRYRLFDLDRWAYRIVLGVSAAFGLLLLDAALISGLRLQDNHALGISVLLIAIAYLPLRSLLWRKMATRNSMTEGEMFQRVDSVRFAIAETDRRERWQAFMAELFDPLEIVAPAATVDRPRLLQDGLEMTVPPVAGGNGLLLRFAGRGHRLFSPQQAGLIEQLLALMRSADTIRDSYSRGVSEERARIARDLHDDVSGRLLTSLDRPNRSLIRQDVQSAVADIRSIIRGLSGERLAVSQVVANLRHETFSRLDAAGIKLEWPIELEPSSDPILDYARYRNLSSACREAVTNILRHAGASQVTVRHQIDELGFRLIVADDGSGVATPSDPAGGRGLLNIERRLREIGGYAAFTQGGHGFRVELFAPLSPSV